MNNSADTMLEQLSAYMDGELPEAEARFMLRRLEHDAELRATWARMHLAASCIKGQPVRVMSVGVGDAIRSEIAQAPVTSGKRPMIRWAMAASIAALALLFTPRLLQVDSSQPAEVAVSPAAPVTERALASPASADLIASTTPQDAVVTSTGSTASAAATAGPDFIERNPEVSAQASPIPLSMQSPEDFPLVDGGEKRGWPRSELAGSQNDPALEAYLVRHNQMLADEGLGGFVPYVDVVSSEAASAMSEDAVEASATGTEEQ